MSRIRLQPLLKKSWERKKQEGSKVHYHNPVMLRECMEGMAISESGIYVDVTFGGGGHSKGILSSLGVSGRLISFDRDPDAAANVIDDIRFKLVKDNFKHMFEHLRELKALPINGVLADLGVSSHQFDEATRGFAFRFEHDLDMRMDQQQELTARKLLNTYSEAQLTRVFKVYGELTQAKRMAVVIVESRKSQPIETSSQLLTVLSRFIPRDNENQIMAKVYQALRIEVNGEMEALEALLAQSAAALVSGGRMAVLSYHSLEDRLVKNFFRHGNVEGNITTDLYGNKQGLVFREINRKPLLPSEDEIKENPRARSAKLRVAEKI